MDQVEALLPTLELPPSTEFDVEPALDYPGQQVAIDLYAPSENLVRAAVATIQDAIFHHYRIATRTSSELDRELLAKRASA